MTHINIRGEYNIKLQKVMEKLGVTEATSAIKMLVDMFLEGELKEELLERELKEIELEIARLTIDLEYLKRRKERLLQELEEVKRIKRLEEENNKLKMEIEELKKKLEELQTRQIYTQINNINKIVVKIEDTKIIEIVRLVLAWVVMQLIKNGAIKGLSLQDIRLADDEQLVNIQRKIINTVGLPVELQTLKLLKENLDKFESMYSVFEIRELVK